MKKKEYPKYFILPRDEDELYGKFYSDLLYLKLWKNGTYKIFYSDNSIGKGKLRKPTALSHYYQEISEEELVLRI